MATRGYVFIHKLSTGEYEAIGYDWRGFVITDPTWDKDYKKAYNRIYSKLRVRRKK